jgi:hypothetical protein
VNSTCDLKINVSKYALAGGLYVSASSWQDPPQGPPNNPKECGGGVDSPMIDRGKDAKALFTIEQMRRDAMMTIGSVDRVTMKIGALHEKREQDHVYENSSDPPRYADQPNGIGKAEQR